MDNDDFLTQLRQFNEFVRANYDKMQAELDELECHPNTSDYPGYNANFTEDGLYLSPQGVELWKRLTLSR